MFYNFLSVANPHSYLQVSVGSSSELLAIESQHTIIITRHPSAGAWVGQQFIQIVVFVINAHVITTC